MGSSLPRGHVIHEILLVKGLMVRVVLDLLVLRRVHLVVRCHGNRPGRVVVDVLRLWNRGVNELWLLVVHLRVLWISLGIRHRHYVSRIWNLLLLHLNSSVLIRNIITQIRSTIVVRRLDI
ncbi:hypothetical protein HanHA300_Chr15g0561221 [Helianthus annuus]|nr:hypothetical protein HanHA300_Chr15g0561221 [Helianthus annuus]KAJ0472739.1 hypothetical protein HanHA89_Chr15g0610431 [Helianthus annuus]KAJ0648346.1 hypothetical protein HanLR1_Chr15g0571841 [Helianthus annuus]